jgi:hypothetical protein
VRRPGIVQQVELRAKSCALRPVGRNCAHGRRGPPWAPCSRALLGLASVRLSGSVADEQAARARPLLRGVATCRYAAALTHLKVRNAPTSERT